MAKPGVYKLGNRTSAPFLGVMTLTKHAAGVLGQHIEQRTTILIGALRPCGRGSQNHPLNVSNFGEILISFSATAYTYTLTL